MRYLLLASFLLVGCDPTYVTMRCPKDGVGCEIGGKEFSTKEACEDFARKAMQVQPNVVRICVEGKAQWTREQ